RSAGSAIRGPDAGVTPQWAAGDQGDSLVTASANLRKRAPFHPERTRSALRAAPDRVAMLEGEGPMGPVVAIPGVEVLEELGKRCPGSAFRVRRGTAVYSIEVALLTSDRAEQRGAIQRFRRDAIALARIRHPALPRVLEVGERSAAHYVVMELVAGETLAE